MNEIWKAIDGFDGYEVSNLGRVRSVDRVVTTKAGQRKYRGKIRAQSADSRGYKHISFWKNGRQFGFVVHRLVAAAFLRRMMPGEEVNHDDLDKSNNIDRNFEITTHAVNMEHATKAGRMAKKLTEQMVREIKFAFLWGENKINLARQFGVTRAAINAIVFGRAWKRVNLSEWLSAHD